MLEYQGMQLQVDIRIDGQYYCRIYKQGIPGPIFFTDDYEKKEEVIEAAKEIIRNHQEMP